MESNVVATVSALLRIRSSMTPLGFITSSTKNNQVFRPFSILFQYLANEGIPARYALRDA
jgi:hypothetical protein